MQQCRDSFLDSVLARFGSELIDLAEISEILSAFKEPFLELNGENEDQSLTGPQKPWGFECLAINKRLIAPEEIEVHRVSHQMEGLNIEACHGQESWRRGAMQTETDEAMVFSTAETSVQGTGRGPPVHNLAMVSQGSICALEEESKSSHRQMGNLSMRDRSNPCHLPEERTPPELGRPSLSE